MEIISFGGPEPRPTGRRRPVVGLLVVAGLVLAVAGEPRTAVVASPRPAGSTAPGCVPVGWAQSPSITLIAGLALGDEPGQGLDRCDRAAVDGPWSVIVRAPGGSLGRHGAVVTFPVEAPRTGRPVGVGRERGSAAGRAITWPLAKHHARVRGDLAEADLIALATRTRIVDGRPVVDPPAGLTVVASVPLRPPTVHELRYGAADLGEQGELGGGLVYTGVSAGGGFEDQLYATVETQDGPPLAGRPTVVSPVSGGNATLAWEAAPGVVAYVGYSGAQLDPGAITPLHRLATAARVLSGSDWQATTPTTADQLNEPG
ncbi:hypothetical protein [Asanoa siamensis]|uniref:Uncharacterized protein n=1 Tax=Asanoa siamensis TaxID=926357 RepID=A0ABQ4D206_9ACTN|nr:hypothetical protein [Asanoa siamensis]GIF77559.1 hypothetical protein Asi02nite_70770 [Asanoa siamensis]